MLNIPFLRNILLISLAIALAFPLYNSMVLAPAYQRVLLEETEDEAGRYASYLMNCLDLDRRDLAHERLPEEIDEEVRTLMTDTNLRKVKVYAPSGLTLYSSHPDEIGKINDSDFFHSVVAQGVTHSSAVSKDQPTADGPESEVDLVETYVPIMVGNDFNGAIEIYFDITESRQRLSQLHHQSQQVLTGISLALILLIILSLARATIAIRKRREAELSLKKSHEKLEQRVELRTREVQCALSDSEKNRKRMDAILTAVPDVLLASDNGGYLLLANAAAAPLLNTTLSHAQGRSLEEVLRDFGLARRLSEALSEMKELEPLTFDWPDTDTKTEGATIFQVRATPLQQREGEVPGMIVLMQDVTRERAVERMKSEFLAMATHELNTPLTAILGYTELLENRSEYGFSQQQLDEFNRLIVEKAEHLSRIVGDMTDAGRYEAGESLELNREAIPPRGALKTLVEGYRKRHPDRRWEYQPMSENVLIDVDPERFRQAIDYLLSNAVKYSSENTEIRLLERISDRGYELVVSDQGIGLDATQRASVFDAFYRADASDTAIGGTGLGLSIVQVIVQSHGGEVRIESEKGEGTHIHLCFPLPRAQQIDTTQQAAC